MKYNFDEAQTIIEDLQQAITKNKQIRDGIKKNNPDWEQLSDAHWEEKKSRCWLHGATEIFETNELERWLFETPPLSDTAKESASKCVKCWIEWLNQSDAFYDEHSKNFELENPEEGEILRDYVLRMAILVEKGGKGDRLKWRALKSFLAYLRNIAPEEIAFIEQIFPKKMDLHFNSIIRKISPEVYPISQEVTSDILCELAQLATKGRPNSLLSALEALGLNWLCLTTSRLRWPTHLEMVEKIKVSAIKFDGEYPMILVPTLFGEKEIRISIRVAKFLIALSKIPSKNPRMTIIQLPRRSLSRTLERAVQNVVNPNLGIITFVTMLSTPHIFGRNHRYKPK